MRITTSSPLVLGSGSPRRKELLGLLGVPVVVAVPHVDEARAPGESPEAYLARVVREKLDAVRGSIARDRAFCRPGGVLVADTIVVAPGGDILGKPKSFEQGRAMLLALEGKSHDVCTRFSLARAAENVEPAISETVTTRVWFRAIPDSEACAYAASGEGSDKAGGYAVQGAGAAFVARIEGSYTNVVGLPLCEVVVAMRSLGWLGGP